MIQFFYFCDVSEDIVKFFLLSLVQGATRCNNAAELNDLMLQTTPRSSVFSGGCPSLGSNLAPRTSTYLGTLHWSDDARAHREGCAYHLWHACHRFATTDIDFDTVIRSFAKKKARKLPFQ